MDFQDLEQIAGTGIALPPPKSWTERRRKESLGGRGPQSGLLFLT